MLPFFLLLFFTYLLIKVIVQHKKQPGTPPLPLSPPSDPLIGHLRYIPAENPEIKFTEWAKTYGDVMYLKILNRPVIVLSSAETALDLLDKRSGKYSDRPHFPIFDIMGYGNSLALLPYGKKFLKSRQMFQEYFSSTKVAGYADLQTVQARQLSMSFIEGKEDKEDILQQFATAVVIRIAFGHDIFRELDHTYDDLIKANKYITSHCGPMGGTPADLFPILKYFPSCFPGMLYVNRARDYAPFIQRLHDYPAEKIRQQLETGTAKPCFLSHHMELLMHAEKDELHEDFRDVKFVAGSIFSAGADTMWSTLSVFLLAMVLHPECQVKAHEELDRILGNPLQRLPDFGDRHLLPYIDCIVQETYRWLPVTPLAIPHQTIEDDIYQGMLIPKDTVIFPNVWGISRDERIYRDPSTFNPSRYLPATEDGNGEPWPVAPFGFGRRKCPGRHLADTNFWIAAATMLALFKIDKVKDNDGKEIVPEVGTQTGLSSHPKPYHCKISLRNESSRALAEATKAELSNLS